MHVRLSWQFEQWRQRVYDVSMSLANKITIGRALLIAPTLYLLLSGHRIAALILFGFASLGDVLDGWAARARNEITTWGKVLDPTADKALYVSVVCSLYVLGDMPLFGLILFLIPQVAIGIGAIALHYSKRRVQAARIPGKAAAFLTFISVAFLIARWPGGIEIFYAALLATYIAGFDYMRAAFSSSNAS